MHDSLYMGFREDPFIPMIKLGIARTVRPAILRVLPALLLMLAAPVSAEQTGSPNLFAGIAAGGVGQPTADQPGMDDNPTDTEDTEAIDYPIGIFITSLHDLDVTADTFGVDYWVWSVHPPRTQSIGDFGVLQCQRGPR